jgi:hypothetical protein
MPETAGLFNPMTKSPHGRNGTDSSARKSVKSNAAQCIGPEQLPVRLFNIRVFRQNDLIVGAGEGTSIQYSARRTPVLLPVCLTGLTS